MQRLAFLVLTATLLAPLWARAEKQLIVAIAPDWDSSKGKLQRFVQSRDGWKPEGKAVPALFGRRGLAWGIGLHPAMPGLQKVERDKRSPAGLFQIGKIYTYDAKLPKGADFPFVQVTEADAWIDDPENPLYNRHVRVDPKNPPPWFEKQKMRHNDFAYRWLVEIRHNSDPPLSGKGSAIFFHIRRGENKPSSGCTTLAEQDLVQLIRWLRADARPRYALLPKPAYMQLWKDWNLPSPEEAAAILD
jgi:L,D-peptidoglycan transpeptidase YkuD (ErfK/YbiS/YcfS/YnhG family)